MVRRSHSHPIPTIELPRDAAPPTLPDVLAPGLDLVFVGINPSVYSAERGQYFARPSNAFWRCLHAAGLVPVPLGPADGPRLPAFGIGLTDLVKRPTPGAAALTADDFAAGRAALYVRLLACAPRVVCFVGKLAYERFSGRRAVAYGHQPERIGDSAVFVMPSTSGRANRLHGERLRCLMEVRAFLGR
jgi:TDG/mug DNA glycosylase family protein